MEEKATIPVSESFTSWIEKMGLKNHSDNLYMNYRGSGQTFSFATQLIALSYLDSHKGKTIGVIFLDSKRARYVMDTVCRICKIQKISIFREKEFSIKINETQYNFISGKRTAARERQCRITYSSIDYECDTIKFNNHKEVVNTEERIERLDSLREAAKPLIKYLNENHHPHTTAIVTLTSVEVLEGVSTVRNIDEYIVD